MTAVFNQLSSYIVRKGDVKIALDSMHASFPVNSPAYVCNLNVAWEWQTLTLLIKLLYRKIISECKYIE